MANEPNNLPILITKLQPPSQGKDLLERSRITTILNSALSYPLVLVTAPTGYGKTTLLAAFAYTHPSTTAWLSLEEADNDPVRFWEYFIAALTKIIPEIHLNVPIIIPGLGSNLITGALDDLCNQMANTTQSVVFVLDDFQMITHANILHGITYAIDHVPANFHLVISTRKAPLLPLSRLRAKNRLVEIHSSKLAFTESEAGSFLRNSQNSRLNQAQIQRVSEITHGWPAGIRLMEITLREDANRLDAWKEGKKLAVDFLTCEIIEQIPDKWADFLEKVAVFDQFTIEAAHFLAGSENTADLVDQIIQANLFIDRRGNTYQLHPFFREALMQRWAEADCRLLNQSAFTWFEAQSMPERAIQHAFAIEDWENAKRITLLLAEDKLQKGEIHTLENWLLQFPKNVLAENPDLQVLEGWVCYWLGNIPEAHKIAHSLDEMNSGSLIQNKGLWIALRCQLAQVQEQNQLSHDLAQTALDQLDASSIFVHSMLLSSLASSKQALGDSEGAIQYFKQSIAIIRSTGNLLMTVFSLINLGIELDEMGQRQQALVLCDEILEEIKDAHDENSPLLGLIDLLLARLYWESNELELAQKTIDESKEKLGWLGIPGIQISGDLILAMILIAREEFNDALNLINKNRRRTRSGEFIGFKQLFDMMRAEIYLKMGNLAIVKEWLEAADLPPSPFDDPARELEFLLRTRYLLEIRSIDEASQMLDELIDYGKKNNHVRVSMAALFIKANLEWMKGNISRVKIYLENALSLVPQQRYIRLFLEYGGPLLGLIAQMPGVPEEICTRFHSADSVDSPTLIELLTPREMDVLRLVVENKTNLEIARQLVLSNETVKVHLKHIFQKLDITDRRQAAHRVRELGLL